jgi:hypothetical protein
MSDRERWIARHLRRLRVGQFLHRAGEWLAAFLIVLGICVLLVKRLVPVWWPQVLWLAAAAVPVTGLAWWLSRRGAFTRAESVALLDRALQADGLLMALSEVPDAEWEEHLPQWEERWRNALPRLRPRRFAACLALPLSFAVGVCFVPLRVIDSHELPPPLTAGQQAALRLEHFLASLQKADVLAREEQAALDAEIHKLVEETQRTPLTHEKWETLDALEQRLRMALTKAQLQTDQLLAAVNTLLEAAAGGLELSDEQRERLEEELLETLMKREPGSGSGSAPGGRRELSELLQRLSQSGAQLARLPSDPNERQKLLSELREHLDQEQTRLAELRPEGAGGQCRACGGQCEHGEGLCRQCQGEGDGPPGRGGVSRGRGDAELTWGSEADEQGIKFKAVVLPPGFQEDPQEEVLGVQLTAPQVDPAAPSERAAARRFDPATGRETWERYLRPRHKGVVKQYFQSDR